METLRFSLQEAAGRVRPFEKSPRQERSVPAAFAARDAPGVAAERSGRRAHRRGQAAAAAQRSPGGPHADTGGPQQTAGVPAAQAEATSGAGDQSRLFKYTKHQL